MKLKANLILLAVTAIWGVTFAVQRATMEYIGPYTFNGLRFVLGGMSLLPIIFLMQRRQENNGQKNGRLPSKCMQAFL